MDRSSTEIETEMADLTDVSFEELRADEAKPLESYLNRVMISVARPRMNLGGAGPPGRVD